MATAPDDYKPELEDLGAIMRARTKDDLGNELGTFTEDTRPTADEAIRLIDKAQGLVSSRLGSDGSVPDRLAETATALVCLRAAMLVETSYFAEETDTTESAYERYREQYRDGLTDFDAASGHDVGQRRRKFGTIRVGTLLTEASRLDSDVSSP